MSRHNFPGKTLVDAVLDIPIVLPPLVIGLCLLILFNSSLASSVESFLHTIEHFLGNNLIPFCFLSFLIILGLDLLFFITSQNIKQSSKNWDSSRADTVSDVAIHTLLPFSQVTKLDARPCCNRACAGIGYVSRSTSSFVITTRLLFDNTRYEGKGNELITALKKQWKEDKLLDGDIKLIPQLQRDGTNTGKQLLITTFTAGVDVPVS